VVLADPHIPKDTVRDEKHSPKTAQIHGFLVTKIREATFFDPFIILSR
jgi:hypothetical protein